MDIAALSISMSMERTAQAVQTSMLKKTMEQAEMVVQNLIEGMEAAATPPSSNILDVRA